jgi:transcriptional regulator with XRE-family HTH domain
MRGLRQRQLSTEHVSYAYLSRIEAGARNPSVKALRETAPKLGVSVHYLETGDEDPLWSARRLIEGLLEDRRRLRRQARALRLRARELELDAKQGYTIDLELLRSVREASDRAINSSRGEEGTT